MYVPNQADTEEFAERRRRLMEAVGPKAVVIVPAAVEMTRNRDVHYPFRQDSDFWYLTGFVEPEAMMVLAPGRESGEFLLFVRPRDAEREIWDGRRAGPEGAVRDYGADQAFDIDEFDARLPDLLSGRETVCYTLGQHPKRDAQITACVRQIAELSRRGPSAPASVAFLDQTLHEQRLFKSEHELQWLRHACQVSAAAHSRAMRYARPGRHEYQVAAEIHHEFAQAGMEPGYGSIVGAGDNACILHYVENDAELKDGDLLLIDAGGEFRGYTADITRTFPVNGKFTGPQRAVYEVVLASQLAAIDCMKPGVSSGLPHEIATRVLTEGLVELGLLSGDVDELIASDAQKRFFMHGTGHWLGLDVHDVGRYRTNGEPRPFAEGMVMTVEPGLYIAPGSEGVDPRFHGIGVRIEDDVLITADGSDVLTSDVPKSVAAIEALMAESVA